MLHILKKEVECPHCLDCLGKDISKNGKRLNGIQHWRCNKLSCKKSFQTHYTYNACKAGVIEQIVKQIVEQTLNSSGVRDVSRNLKVDKNTVVSVYEKKSSSSEPVLAG